MNRLRSVARIVVDKSSWRNFSFSALPGDDVGVMSVVASLTLRGISCWIGYRFVGPFVDDETAANLEEERQKMLREKYGESAEIRDLTPGLGESIWSCLKEDVPRMWSGRKS